MFDKLDMVTSDLILPKDVKNRIQYATHQRTSGGARYELLDKYYVDGRQTLSIKSHAKVSSTEETKIELNPSNYDSYQDLGSILNDLCRVEELRIKRIDHAIDLEIPFAQLSKSLYAKRKNTRSDFRGATSTGMWAGSSPEVLCMYDKALELKSKYRKNGFKRIKQSKVGIWTRLEVRQMNRKVCCSSFLDLPNAITHDPFHFIEFYDLLDDVEKLSAIEKAKYYKLKSEAYEKGFIGLYKENNVHCNFWRDNKNWMKLSPLTQEIKEIYQSNLKAFFDGN